jgi:hypothetical protein
VLLLLLELLTLVLYAVVVAVAGCVLLLLELLTLVL